MTVTTHNPSSAKSLVAGVGFDLLGERLGDDVERAVSTVLDCRTANGCRIAGAREPWSMRREFGMREDGFQCRQCGHCCINASGAFSACATEADIARWEAAGRDDILAWVEPIALGDERVYDLWIDPETGDDVSCCPWLETIPGTDRYLCRIHDLKPDHCRRYPRSREHADETGCPGYDKV